MKNEELLNFKVLSVCGHHFPLNNGDFPMKNMVFLLAVIVFSHIFAS